MRDWDIDISRRTWRCSTAIVLKSETIAAKKHASRKMQPENDEEEEVREVLTASHSSRSNTEGSSSQSINEFKRDLKLTTEASLRDEDIFVCRFSYDLDDDFAHPHLWCQHMKLSPQKFAMQTMRVMERWQLTMSSVVGDDSFWQTKLMSQSHFMRRWTLPTTHIMLHIPSGLTNRKESV